MAMVMVMVMVMVTVTWSTIAATPTPHSKLHSSQLNSTPTLELHLTEEPFSSSPFSEGVQVGSASWECKLGTWEWEWKLGVGLGVMGVGRGGS
jgi:hypothetical protein